MKILLILTASSLFNILNWRKYQTYQQTKDVAQACHVIKVPTYIYNVSEVTRLPH